jgi:hypothetical protein
MRNKARDLPPRTTQRDGAGPQEGYEIGYKKPPRESRFQPGRSGNPSGRPKGSVNRNDDSTRKLADIVREESKRIVTLQQGGEMISLPSDRAVVRSITSHAIRGNPSAQKTFIFMQKELKASDDGAWGERLAKLVAYKNGWRALSADYKRRGIVPPAPNPRPESIEIDEDNRVAYFIEVAGLASGEGTRTNLPKRKLGTDDYDWLRRNTPDTTNVLDISPQPLLTRDELEKLPHHVRRALWVSLKGIQDLHEGKFVYLKPPRRIYDLNFVTPCGREMPLRGMECHPVEADDAEILLSQGWTLVDQDK